MALPADIVEQVRRRANFACEYCGAREVDSAGQLTVDHYQPRARGGNDDLDNLLYCCYRCNLFKSDYWPTEVGAPVLWNPRQEPLESHLLLLANGKLHPITATGEFTLHRLRLNRPQLIAYRRGRLFEEELAEVLDQHRTLLDSIKTLHDQYKEGIEENKQLLREQRGVIGQLPKVNGQGKDST
jgi:hypothetical protein